MSASNFNLSDVSAQDIVETVRDGLLVLDADLTVVSANSAFYSMFATAADRTIGRRLYDLGNGQWDIPALRVLLEEILPRETTVEAYEVKHDFPGVGLKIMLLNARKVRRARHNIEFFLLTIDDVTELRKEQRRATRNLHLSQTIVDTARDPLVILDSDMKIVTASRNFILMFGDSAENVVGHRLEDLKQGQWNVTALRALLDHVVPDDRPFDDFLLEDEFPALGHRIFKLYARKIHVPGNHGTQLLLVFEDATKETLFDRHKDVLAAELAHRIKNSLQVISSFVGYELRRAADPCVEGYRAMQARISAVAELYDVIAKSSAFGPVKVEAYLEGIASSLHSSLLGQKSKIDIVVDAEPLTILADHAVPLGLMVNELATNAIKYAFPKGAGRITLGFQRRDDEVTLTVEDNGVGMSAASSGSGLGSRFLDAFAMQLGGTLTKASAETEQPSSSDFLRRFSPEMEILPQNEREAGGDILRQRCPTMSALAVGFRQVVHLDRTGETGVTKLQHPREGPNEHPQECPSDAAASRGDGALAVIEGCRSKAQAARTYGVSAKIVARWVERYRASGHAGMADRSSRPARMQRSPATVSRVLKRAGLSRLKDIEPAEPVVRYERAHPGEMIHIDIKKLGRFERVGHRIIR